MTEIVIGWGNILGLPRRNLGWHLEIPMLSPNIPCQDLRGL